jgi:hypothetical protein
MLIAAVALLAPAPCLGQAIVRAEDVRVASEQERYLRALASRAAHPVSWMIRPVDPVPVLHALSAVRGPWLLQPPTATTGVRISSLFAELTANSGLPSSEADGSAWSGRGTNLRASAAIVAEHGPLRIRLSPEAWVAQNLAFDLIPTDGVVPFIDAATPISIDLPQRFGDGLVARLDPGESAIALEWRRARVALTSEASQLGPGGDHALVLQGNAGGIPRFEVAMRPLETRLGAFAAHVAWGRSAQTAWAPERASGALFTSYLVGTWRPPLGDRLELGAVRLFHRAWDGLSARNLLVPFGSAYHAKWAGGSDSVPDNQLASVFARVRVPEAGLEFFGEFGKNDRSRSLRDQMLELEHNAAWLAGAQKTWTDDADRLWALNLVAVSGAISHITRFRGQAWFYEHSPLRQGHTLRGQLLGSPLLQREGGGELRLERYDPAGRDGLVLRTRSLPNERSEFVAPGNVRQEWSVMFERTRWKRRGYWRLRAGGVADLGYSPAGDAYNLHLAFSRSLMR